MATVIFWLTTTTQITAQVTGGGGIRGIHSRGSEGPHQHQQDFMIFSLRREPPLLVHTAWAIWIQTVPFEKNHNAFNQSINNAIPKSNYLLNLHTVQWKKFSVERKRIETNKKTRDYPAYPPALITVHRNRSHIRRPNFILTAFTTLVATFTATVTFQFVPDAESQFSWRSG